MYVRCMCKLYIQTNIRYTVLTYDSHNIITRALSRHNSDRFPY